MDPVRLHERCPEATIIGPAKLPGYTLSWHHTARSQGGAVADLAMAARGVVWGVLYAVPDGAPWRALCKCEGFQPDRDNRFNNYLLTVVTVTPIDPEVGSVEAPVSAVTFYVNPVDLRPLPTRKYKAYLIRGARYHDLPESYISSLEAIPTIN